MIRLENSPENDVSCAGGSSPLPRRLMWSTLGSVSSSETNGSSMASVDGKNRLPASPWADTGATTASTISRETTTARQCLMATHLRIADWNGANERGVYAIGAGGARAGSSARLGAAGRDEAFSTSVVDAGGATCTTGAPSSSEAAR